MTTTVFLAILALGEAPGIKGEFRQAELGQPTKPLSVAVQVGRKTMLLFGLTFNSKEEAEAVKKWLNDNYRHKQPPKVLPYKIVVEGSKPSEYAVIPRGGQKVPIQHWMNAPGTMAKGILYDPDGRNLNAEFIRKGMARTKEKRFEDDQEEAKKNKVGIWAK